MATALELNPSSWRALLTRAALRVELSRRATNHRSLLRLAAADLDQAVALNPLAEYDAAPIRREAEASSR